MRLIDADALQREYMQFHDGKRSVLVDVAPTIEPERKKGKWIKAEKHYYKDDDNAFYYYEIRCSECGAIRKIGWHDAKFCPNCGAYMRGEEDDDNKWLLCPNCGTAIMKDEYYERARKIAVFLSTEIKWYDRLERMPDEVSGRFLVLMITGNVLTCDYYNGHWNATESYIGSAFEPQDVIAWAEIPKELIELARKRWKEVYE